jgi:hypothetical protein
MKKLISLCLFVAWSSLVVAQDSLQLHQDWTLDEMGHQLTIKSLPAKLPSDLLVIKISYPDDLTNNAAFYKMGKPDFYLSRKNAFRVNRCRLSGRVEGYDNAGDKRYAIDFRRGKLDGSFTMYRTNGKVETQVYSNGKLHADVLRSKKEKMNR